MTNSTLSRLAKKIKTLEKDSVRSAVEIGGLLEQAAAACDHGDFQDWVAREFAWSYRTSVRYRSVYALAAIVSNATASHMCPFGGAETPHPQNVGRFEYSAVKLWLKVPPAGNVKS